MCHIESQWSLLSSWFMGFLMLHFSKCFFPNRIASVSKIFPTIMLYKMWEEGKVTSLDDPLERYVKNFVIKNPLGRLKDSEQRYTADGLVFLEKGSVPLKPSLVTLRRMASQLSGKELPDCPHIPGIKKLFSSLCTYQGSGRALRSRVSATSWSAQRKLLSRTGQLQERGWDEELFYLICEHRFLLRWTQIPFSSIPRPGISLQLHNSFFYSRVLSLFWDVELRVKSPCFE